MSGKTVAELMAQIWDYGLACSQHHESARERGIAIEQAIRRAVDWEQVAWLCEFVTADESTERQVVFEDPDGLRFNDVGEPSPFRTTPLYARKTP